MNRRCRGEFLVHNEEEVVYAEVLLARVLIWFVALAGLGLYAVAQSQHGQRLRKRDR